MKPLPSDRSLRILLLAGIFVLVGQLAVATWLDAAPLGVRFPRARAIVEKARAMDPPPRVVLFGSSRLDAAVDVRRLNRLLAPGPGAAPPAVLSATVMGGEGYSFEFLDRALRTAGVHPCTAVVEILPETVAEKVRFLDGALIRHFTWHDVFAALPDIRRSGFLGVLAETRLEPVFFYRSEILGWTATALRAEPRVSPRPGLAAGAAAPAPAKARPRRTEPRRLRIELGKARRNLADYRIGGGAKQALERTLAALAADGSQTILVAPPVMEAHRALYRPAIEAAFQTYVGALAQRFQLRFVDWRAALPDEAMFDNHHANDEGRRRVTPLLARVLRLDAAAGAGLAGRPRACPSRPAIRAGELPSRPGALAAS